MSMNTQHSTVDKEQSRNIRQKNKLYATEMPQTSDKVWESWLHWNTSGLYL